MIQRFAALARRRNGHLQVLTDAVLPDVVVEDARAQAHFVLRVIVDLRGCDQAIVHAYLASSRSAWRSVCSKSPDCFFTAASTAFSASGRW